MIEKQSLQQLNTALTRIFALPLGRTTFREVQSAYISAAKGDLELFGELMESVLSGQVKPSLKTKIDTEAFKSLITEFSLKTLISKDVHDKAQFISFITSDVLSQPNGVVFSNCIKTVEGQEHRFLTDIESTLQLIQHFIGRIQEANKLEVSKEKIVKLRGEIEKLIDGLDTLTTHEN